jgi:hypothetical protein
MRPRFALVVLIYFAVANAALAVGYGWQDLPDGGIEFWFRVEPGQLETFPGAYSDLPRGIPEIRRIQVVVSKDPVPNEGTLPKPVAKPADAPGAESEPSSKPGGPPGITDKTTASPPPGGTLPTAYTDSPPATPLENQSTGIGISTRAEHNTDKRLAAPDTNATDLTQPPHLEGKDLTKEKDTHFKVEVPESRPWLPLTGALVALFASLGANAYLGWVHQSLRSNYRSLVARMKGDPATA